ERQVPFRRMGDARSHEIESSSRMRWHVEHALISNGKFRRFGTLLDCLRAWLSRPCGRIYSLAAPGRRAKSGAIFQKRDQFVDQLATDQIRSNGPEGES